MRWTAAQLSRYQTRQEISGQASRHRHQLKGAQRWAAPEQQVHETVAELLRRFAAPNVHWHHPATGELRDFGTACKLKRMGVRAGLPDFLLLIAGKLHGLELKREQGGRLGPEQLAMHIELRTAGAVIETVHGLDQALAVLRGWGALRFGIKILTLGDAA